MAWVMGTRMEGPDAVRAADGPDADCGMVDCVCAVAVDDGRDRTDAGGKENTDADAAEVADEGDMTGEDGDIAAACRWCALCGGPFCCGSGCDGAAWALPCTGRGGRGGGAAALGAAGACVRSCVA